jgi:hypothetical protein
VSKTMFSQPKIGQCRGAGSHAPGVAVSFGSACPKKPNRTSGLLLGGPAPTVRAPRLCGASQRKANKKLIGTPND